MQVKSQTFKSLMNNQDFIEAMNAGLIILVCLLAHLYPFHLLIFSYAILGPAHYLTQISWLHDRQYFAQSRYIAPALLVLTLALLAFGRTEASAALLVIALGLSAASVMTPRKKTIAFILGLTFALAGLAVYFFGTVGLFLVFLLPTVMHIYVFTGSFMAIGAMKKGRRSSFGVLGIFLIAGLSFLFPQDTPGLPDLSGLDFFIPIVDYMQRLVPKASVFGLFGFLAFAYTYHYLNWFSKAEIIRWTRIPPRRIQCIIGLYLFFELAYFIDYQFGFLLVLFVSLLHVVLEFPLNMRIFAALGATVFRKSIR